MSYEAYVNHILQKHRLAISIAVIKSKPHNISIHDHIQKIREAINKNMDDDISVCSNDFLIDETDFDITEDELFTQMDDTDNLTNKIATTQANSINKIEYNEKTVTYESNITKNDEIDDEIKSANKNDDLTLTIESKKAQNDETNDINETHDIDINDTQISNNNVTIINDELSQMYNGNDLEMNDTQMSNDSVNILQNFELENKGNENTKERISSDDVRNILKDIGIHITSEERIASHDSQLKYTEENIIFSQQLDLTQCSKDIDATQCESLDILANVAENILSQKHSYNFHDENQLKKSINVEQTDKYKNVDATTIISKQCIDKVKCDSSTNNIKIKPHTEIAASNPILQNKVIAIKSNTIDLRNYRHTKEFKNICKNVASMFKSNKDKDLNEDMTENNLVLNTPMEKPKDKAKYTQDAVKIDLTQDFTCRTHYSQSQSNDHIHIDDKFIHGTKRKVKHGTKRKVNNTQKKPAPKRKKKTNVTVLGNTTINTTRTTKKKSTIVNEKLLIEVQLPMVTSKDEKSNKIKSNELKEAINTTKANNDYQPKSQLTDCDAQTVNSETYNYNNDINFSNIQNNEDILNSQVNKSNSNDYKIFNEDSTQHMNKNVTNEHITLCDNISKLYDNYSLFKNKESLFSGEDTIGHEKATYNMLFENAKHSKIDENATDITLNVNAKNSTLQDNDRSNMLIENAKHSMLDENAAKSTLNVNVLNTDAKKNVLIDNSKNNILNENAKTNVMDETAKDSIQIIDNIQNTKSKINQILRDLYLDNSQITQTYPMEPFQHDTDNTGLTDFDNCGTFNPAMNYHTNFGNKTNNEILGKNDIIFENTSNVHTQLRNTNYDNSLNIETLDTFAYNENQNLENAQLNPGCTNFDNNENTIAVTDAISQNDEPNRNGCTNFDENSDFETDVDVEKVPFKIITELNKVKLFLNKRNENIKICSGDTGYRSDSNSKNTLNLSQTPIGLDQSAHSLYKYITECPLVCTTQEITEEISLVLGQLIDRLQEEERYPTFLEEMLETIKNIIQDVYHGNTDENTLTKNDELIDRIILLNKSLHIQKYTIEKITIILKNIHSELITNESFEIQNIDKIENVCYIFHLLEILLHKHNKASQNLSQRQQNLSQNMPNLSQNAHNLSQNIQHLNQNTENSTQNTQYLTPNTQNMTQNLSQNTQEDKLLKKSNIIDIWKRKWNPNYKISQNEGSSEKRCVITDCNAILNKIIVGCMEGYSLISYYALKCFNLTQT